MEKQNVTYLTSDINKRLSNKLAFCQFKKDFRRNKEN